MTENTPKGPARLLIEAWQIVRRWQGGPEAWPDEFQPVELAALMAGCQYKEDKSRYATEARLIAAGVKSGALAVRTVEEKHFTPGSVIDTGTTTTFAGQPARVKAETRAIERTTRRQFIDRPACAAWLRAIDENPSECVRAWLGPEWKESAPRIRKGSADDSRPGEREAYFRTLWIEFDKPARNEKIWKAMQQRKGSDGCPVVSITANADFKFRYSDGNTDTLDRSIFQKDMSAVRKG